MRGVKRAEAGRSENRIEMTLAGIQSSERLHLYAHIASACESSSRSWFVCRSFVVPRKCSSCEVCALIVRRFVPHIIRAGREARAKEAALRRARTHTVGHDTSDVLYTTFATWALLRLFRS